MIVEVDSHFGFFQLSFLNLWDPWSQLITLVEIVIPVQPVVIFLFVPVPNVVISPMKSEISVICGLLSAHMKSGTIDQDVGHVSFSQSFQSCRIHLLLVLIQPAAMPELYGIVEILMRNGIQYILQVVEGRVFIFEVWGELQEHAAQKSCICQRSDTGFFERGGPKYRSFSVSLH